MDWSKQRIWQQLNPYQRAAAMAIMEADGRNPTDARNVLGAIINRSEKTGQDLGEHASTARTYQPLIEPTQLARLPSILKSPLFQELTALAERRVKGAEPDWVQGATHFLAPEKTMVELHRRDPDKYHNWGPLPNSRGIPGQNWTGYDPATGEYRGVILRDGSHAFLAPDGRPIAAAAKAPQQDMPDAHLPSDARSSAIASAPTGTPALPMPGIGDASPVDKSDAALLYASAFFDKQAHDQEASQSKLAQLGKQAAAAIPKAPGSSPMIQGPRTPRIDMRTLLTVLQQRGVDLTGGGGLGTGGGGLGTRRT